MKRTFFTFTLMKLFQYTYYFFRSLYYRGLVNTFKLLTYEAKFEKKLGIDTHKIVNLDDLTLDGDESADNHHYQGASYYILYNLFNKLPTNVKHAPFIDYGCGKGRALFVAEQCGFTNLIGVDIAKELINDAEKNLNHYQRNNLSSTISFLFCDATKYKIPNDASVFYFFNPFGVDILTKVLKSILLSKKNFPRDIYCLYLNPKYKKVFEELGIKEHFVEKNKHYTEAIVYKL